MQKLIQISFIGFSLLIICLCNMFPQNTPQIKTSGQAADDNNKWPKFFVHYNGYSRINFDSIQRENTLNNSDIVFEGVLKYYCSSNDSLRIPGIAYYITDVRRVFKGNISNKTIKVLFYTGQYEMPWCGTIKSKDSIGIFFCKATSNLKKYLPKKSIDNSNLLILDGFNETGSSGDNVIIINGHPGGFDMDFGNNANCYSYLRSRKGLNVPPYVEPPRVLPPSGPSMTWSQHDSLMNDIHKKEQLKVQQRLKQ